MIDRRVARGILFGAAIYFAAACRPVPAAAPTVTYENRTLGFHLDYPKTWTIKEERFSHSHYTAVFLTINSRRPDFKFQDTNLEDMQPGEIYLEFAFQEGPGPIMLHADTVGKDLRALLASNAPKPAYNPNFQQTSLSFFKRGKTWKVTAYLRTPVSEDDVKSVMALLESVQFVDAPVSNIAWAESLALQELPQAVRDAKVNIGWPVPNDFGERPQAGLQSVVVQRSGANFLFTFTLDKVGEWRVVVTPEGNVTTAPAAK